MEIAKRGFRRWLSNFFVKKKSLPFITRTEINWKSVRNCGIVSLVIGIIVLLFLPNPQPEQGSFHEKADSGTIGKPATQDPDPSQEAAAQMSQGQNPGGSVPRSTDHLTGGIYGGTSSPSTGQDRTASMILTRGGLDSKSQVPPGSRIAVRLLERAIVAGQGMPVIGIVTRDYVHENALAIPKGSKLFGEVSFDDGGDRAKVDWKTIQLPDGRDRQISAVGVAEDGQVGVEGKVHSDALKNTVGQTLTRFIGAYAEGSMQRGALGGNPGGSDNGWKNAVAETAKDRADAIAEDLKKEKRWIEISPTTEFYAVLTGSFVFRDPGTTNGR